jgi:hypothetical protein
VLLPALHASAHTSHKIQIPSDRSAGVYTLQRFDVTAIGLMALPTLAGLVLWDALPARLAIHWSGGQPDSYLAKPLAVFGLFAFGVGTVLFVRYAPDSVTSTPGGEDLAVLFLGGVFAWAQGLVVVWNLGYRFNVGLAVVPVLVAAGLLVWYTYASGAGG